MTNGKHAADFLRDHPTTVVESAIALHLGSHRDVAALRPGLQFRFPQLGRLVGYAVTSTFSTDEDDEGPRRDNLDYWNFFQNSPGPKIAVALDVSREPGSGSSWGRVNANIHRALGARGVITNGGVRDAEEFAAIGFQALSAHLTVGHGQPHWVSFGLPIEMQGAPVKTGDLLCADEHGALVVPAAVLPTMREAIAEVKRRAEIVVSYCQSPRFTTTGLAEVNAKLKNAPAWKPGA